MLRKMASAGVPIDRRYLGGWKILKVAVSKDETANISGLKGAEFTLSDTGDIFWKLSKDVLSTPFFAATFDLYECNSMKGVGTRSIKFIGSQSGDTMEFSVTLKRNDLMHLKYHLDFTIVCEKVWTIEGAVETPFSLYSAFCEGFFSDMTIRGESGKEFAVHKVILKATCPQLAWDQIPPPLSGHSDDVLGTFLHFLYTECLPENMQEETARKCLIVAGKLPGFSRLANLCQLYLHNVAVKNKIVSYINDMHACGDRLAQIFSSRTTTTEGSIRKENFLAEPTKLVYALKQAFREAAVAGVKFLMICDLFSKKKGEMSKHERTEVMQYIKSRLPIFVKQLYKFFEAFREQLTKEITPSQRTDLATYLVPEMDKSLDLITELVEGMKNALEKTLKTVKAREKKKNSTMDYLNKMVKNAMHVKELKQLKSAHEKMCELFQSMMWRQEAFECLSDDDKIFSVNKNIEQLVEEFPQILQKIEKMDVKVNKGFSIKNWKFVFKMGTSRVTWSLEKIVTHRETFKPVIMRLNGLINRDAFQSGLLQVGLLSSVPMKDCSSEVCTSETSGVSSVLESAGGAGPHLAGRQPNIVESLCVSPCASESKLAKAMGELLESGVSTDMCFEVVTYTEEPSDIVVDHTQGHPVESQSAERVETRHLLKAHCMVIAARCDWFRRALLSGMRESIDKKIEVHDTDPGLFKQFLMFLYCGQIDATDMSTDQIADMMALSDRYEVDTLKDVCEGALKSRLDEDSALFLLSLSDQFHAKTLREGTLNYIMRHSFIVDSDVFEELPEHLKTEVQSLVEWNKKGDTVDSAERYRGMQHDTESDSSEEEGVNMSGMAQELGNIGGSKHSRPPHLDSDSMSSDEEEEEAAQAVALDRRRMVECVRQLEEVVGDQLPRDEVEKLVRAADFDVNRAINFYYNSDEKQSDVNFSKISY